MAQGMHTVVVTGFGPFHTNKVNVSWEVAKELTKMGLESQGVNLIAREIPVSYETVCNEIPKIWKEHSPELVIHMGLSNLIRVVCLESLAYRCGYTKPDIHGNTPPGGAYPGTQAAICSQFDLVKIIHKLRKLPDMNVLTALSSDAGRYIVSYCEIKSEMTHAEVGGMSNLQQMHGIVQVLDNISNINIISCGRDIVPKEKSEMELAYHLLLESSRLKSFRIIEARG